jgi:hypothetical protein
MDSAMLCAALFGVAVGAAPLPNDFRPEVGRSKHGVHEHLQVMTGRRVAVKVNTCGRLHDAPEFHQARGHHHEIGQHVAFAEEGPERLKAISHAPARHHDLRKDGFAFLIPCPGVRESLNLTCGLAPVFFREKNVVICVGVERRVQVNEVNRLVFDMPAHHIQIIAVVEQVLRAFRHNVIPSSMSFVKPFLNGTILSNGLMHTINDGEMSSLKTDECPASSLSLTLYHFQKESNHRLHESTIFEKNLTRRANLFTWFN